MTKRGSTKIVNCMNPGQWDSCAKVWPYKSYNSLKNSLFIPRHRLNKLNM